MRDSHDSSHFIPLQTAELIELLSGDRTLPEVDRGALRQLGEALQEYHHLRFYRKQIELKNAYEPFDPDTDDTTLIRLSASQKQQRLNGLFRDVCWLLDRAQYRHLSREDIEPFLANASDWGIRMDVDFSAFEHIAIFARGATYEKRMLRSWRTLYRVAEVEVPIFRRLVLIMKLRQHPRLGPGVNTEHVYMKVFKDIPRADVDMLLPGAKVTLKLMDRGKLGAGVMSGVATMVWRMAHDLEELIRHAAMSDSLAWGLAVGSIGYGWKSYYDYQHTRQAYHLNLTQSLYFQNLDSNAGVLTRLFDEAEEQETRTALLAYYCMWRYADVEGATAEELDLAMELYLDLYAEVPFLCASGEALKALLRLGLAEPCGGRYRAVPLERALQILKSGPADPASTALPGGNGVQSNASWQRKT
jgi:hypothetical protein